DPAPHLRDRRHHRLGRRGAEQVRGQDRQRLEQAGRAVPGTARRGGCLRRGAAGQEAPWRRQ
ncbi:hypothetical protein LTR94_038563, partial [Friedmanniomyces endolithicus]